MRFGRPAVTTVLLVFFAFACAAPSAFAAPSSFNRATADGSRVFFTTADKLTPSDNDGGRPDVYMREGDNVTLISANLPFAGNGPFDASFADASADGSAVFFTTDERMVPEDRDNSTDVYERSGGVTTLISTGPVGGNGPEDADLVAASSDGSRAIFITTEQMTSDDTDNSLDIYERVGNTTTRLSIGASGFAGNEEQGVQFRGASADGTHIFFVTAERLAANDTDNSLDLYERYAGNTTLLSAPAGGGARGNAAFDVTFAGASTDGSIVYFETNEQLLAGDTDSSADVYRRVGGTLTEVSMGTSGGNANLDATVRGVSADGSHAFIETGESLVPADTDSSSDIYDATAGGVSLVSTGPTGGNGAMPANFAGASNDGDTVFFETVEPLVAADTDTSLDVYSRTGGTTTLMSVGPSGNDPAPALFGRASADGSILLFETTASFSPADTDSSRDVYERSGGTTTLVSTGSGSANGAEDANPVGITPDGAHAYISTEEHLTTDDVDASTDDDVFERFAGETRLISGGGTPTTLPDPPTLLRTDPASPADDNDPEVIGDAPGGSIVGIFFNETCTGTPEAIVSGSIFSTVGATVHVEDDTVTTIRATVSDTENNSSPCSPTSLVYSEVSRGPDAPVLAAPSPASPSKVESPTIHGTAPPSTIVNIYPNATCVGPALASGPSDLFATGLQVAVPQNQTTFLAATATNAGGKASVCSAPVGYTHDNIAPGAPEISIAGGGGPSSVNDFNIRGSAEAGSTVEVFRGGQCNGEVVARGTAAALAAGSVGLRVADNTVTEFRAVATDAAGNVSSCSKNSAVYTEDSTPPKTEVTFGPAFKTRNHSPGFRFQDSTADPGTWFQCKLDRRKFSKCSSPKRFRKLSSGKHVLRIRAIDDAGNREAKPAVRKFKIVGKKHRRKHHKKRRGATAHRLGSWTEQGTQS